MTHNQVVQEEFSKQAPRFGEKGLTLSSQEILDWIVGFLPLEKEYRVLDVAAGTGHLSRAIAPYVEEVIAFDITPRMLTQARKETAKRNIDNVIFHEGNAERLPYKGDCFDFVTSRLSIHHFEKPIAQLQEIVRVCRPKHRVAVIDLLAPEDEKIAQFYNTLERLRDPSHTVAQSIDQMENLLLEAGIAIERIETRDIEVDFERWVQMTGTTSETTAAIKEILLEDIGGGTKTGMRPFRLSDSLKFLQSWSIFIGSKISDVYATPSSVTSK